MDYENAVPLTALSEGIDVLVDTVCGHAAHRLRDVGLREGAQIAIVRNTSNVIVRVEGCRIGLRHEIARQILGTPISG